MSMTAQGNVVPFMVPRQAVEFTATHFFFFQTGLFLRSNFDHHFEF